MNAHVKSVTTDLLEGRFMELQFGPGDIREAVVFYCNCDPDGECPWNSLDAVEAELVSRENA